MAIIFNYKINDKIGKGSFSSVYSAHYVNDKKQEFAIKIIKMNKISDHLKSKIKLEVEILSHLKHQHIITMNDSFYHDGLLYLVFERCDIDLYTKITSNQNPIPIQTKIEWIKQLMSGLIYIHKNKIIHRDLKPQNILLDKNNQIKIIDFGFSRYLDATDPSDPTDPTNSTKMICGSPLYMSPEIFIHYTYDYKSDYWSMGLIIYFIIVGNLPYNAKNIMELVAKLKNITDIKISNNIKNLYDDDLINMLESMLIINTKYRISFDDLLKHDFIIKNKINKIKIKTNFDKSYNALNEMINYDDYISPKSNDSEITEINNFIGFINNSNSDNANTNSDHANTNSDHANTNSDYTNSDHTNSETEKIDHHSAEYMNFIIDDINETPFIVNSGSVIIKSKSEIDFISKKSNKKISTSKPIPIPSITNQINKLSFSGTFKDHKNVDNYVDEYLLNDTFAQKNCYSAPNDDNLIKNIKAQYELKDIIRIGDKSKK
jgi:serine/threonine protein kinase